MEITGTNVRSMRQLHRRFVKNEEKHTESLNKAKRQAILSSEATSHLWGSFVVIHVTNCLQEAGTEARTKKKVHKPRIYDLIRVKGDLHSRSRFKRVCKTQISLLQKVGAEIEAFALIYYMEDIMPSGVPLIDEFGRDIHGLFSFSEEVEINLNDLRVMFNS